MTALVRIPTVLRPAMGGDTSVSVEGSTVGEILDHLTAEHPAVKGQFLNSDGTLHRFLNVYVNDDDVRYLGGVDAPVTNGDEISCSPLSPEARCSDPFASVLDLIGQTPIIDVSALSPNAQRHDSGQARRSQSSRFGEGSGGAVTDRRGRARRNSHPRQARPSPDRAVGRATPASR